MEGNDLVMLTIRHHYQMHKRSLDKRVRPYLIIARLHSTWSLSSRYRKGRLCLGDCISGVMTTRDSHISPSSRWSHSRAVGCRRPSRIANWRSTSHWPTNAWLAHHLSRVTGCKAGYTFTWRGNIIVALRQLCGLSSSQCHKTRRLSVRWHIF